MSTTFSLLRIVRDLMLATFFNAIRVTLSAIFATFSLRNNFAFQVTCHEKDQSWLNDHIKRLIKKKNEIFRKYLKGGRAKI